MIYAANVRRGVGWGGGGGRGDGGWGVCVESGHPEIRHCVY